MIYVFHALLAATAFLIVLNGFLRGAKKPQIDAFLSVVLVSLLVACFAFFDWKAGLAAIVLAFAYAIAARPFAARAAVRLLGSTGGPKGQRVGLPPTALTRISKDLAPPDNVEAMTAKLLSESNRSEKAEEALLAYCEANEQVKRVMGEFRATRETLLALYRRLQIAGAGQWAGGHYVSASAIAYPHTLRYLLRTPLETRDQLNAAAFMMLMHFERGAPLEGKLEVDVDRSKALQVANSKIRIHNVNATHPILGWRTWQLSSSSLPAASAQGISPDRLSGWQLQSAVPRGSCLWPVREPMVAECAGGSCTQSPSVDCGCGLSAYREPSYIARRICMAGFSRDFVIGEVRGWGTVIQDGERWRASEAYPHTLTLICSRCLDQRAQLVQAAYVKVLNNGKRFPYVYDGRDKMAMCEAHMHGDGMIPAAEIEEELFSLYGVGRASLPILPERPLTPDLLDNV